MHYIWHYGLTGVGLGKLKDILNSKYGVVPSYVFMTAKGDDIFSLVVDVDERHPRFQEVNNILQNGCPEAGWDGERNALVHYPIYSEDEYLYAAWLTIRSSYSKLVPENNSSIRKEECIIHTGKWSVGRHVRYDGIPVVRSGIKWGRNHIASLVGCEHMLFCDNLTKSVLEKAGIRGIEYGPVLHKITGLPLEGIYQMTPLFTIQNGGILGLGWTSEYTCEKCGMKMVAFSDDRFRFGIAHGAIPDEIDICQTLPIFTSEKNLVDGKSTILISQRMYRVLKENMLDRSLWFEPVSVLTKPNKLSVD